MKTATETVRQTVRDLDHSATRLAIASVRLEQTDGIAELLRQLHRDPEIAESEREVLAMVESRDRLHAHIDQVSAELDQRFEAQVKRIDEAGAAMRQAISKL